MEDSESSDDVEKQESIEKKLYGSALKIRDSPYEILLYKIGKDKLRINIRRSNNIYYVFGGEYTLQDLKNLNRNFRIYDNINELAGELNSYIKQDKIYISDDAESYIILIIYFISRFDRKVDIKLNYGNRYKIKENHSYYEITDKNNFKEELEKKNKEIAYLKSTLDEIKKNNKEYINKKDIEISNFKRRVTILEEALEKLEKKDLTIKSILYDYIDKNKFQGNIKDYNIRFLQKEFKIIKTKKPINKICLFPRSRNYIESSGPKIYDKEHNLIMNLENTIGFCDCIYVASENLVILVQKQNFILLNIINAKKNLYKYYTFKDVIKEGNIKKIIRGRNDLEFFASDDKGVINILRIEYKENKINFILKSRIITGYSGYLNIMIFKKYLILGGDKLYRYKIDGYISDENNINLNNCVFFDGVASGFDGIISFDEKEDLILLGSKSRLYILKCADYDHYEPLKRIIKIPIETSPIDSLCFYGHKFLIAGSNQGNLHFYTFNGIDYIKIINNVHQYDKESNTAINGIIELSDGAFATYGADKKIKIWYI